VAHAVFVGVVLIRFLLPLLIPRFPLPAILGCLVVDAADQSIFQSFTDDPLPGYQTYDKALDVFYLAIAYFSTMRNWRDPVAFEVARFLYIYRLVGVTLFELFHHRWLLLVFPNTFEYFFIAYEAVRTRWNPLRLTATAVVTMAAVIWVFIKLPQEWWIHIAQLDFTEFMADFPFMWGVLLAVAVIVATVIWTQRRRVPQPDWPFTVNVDRHLPPLEVNLAAQDEFFTAALLEKVVVLSMISVIFAQVLPTVRSTNLELAAGVSILVALNAAISQWLRRRGRSWASTATTFVAMLVINIGIVTVDAVLGPNIRGNTPNLNTLFFVLLLSLLTALFDRFRATRDPNLRPRSAWASVRAERAARQIATTSPSTGPRTLARWRERRRGLLGVPAVTPTG
jgi:hypothetical protein